MKKLVVVDADNTIRKPISGGEFPKNYKDQRPINRFIFNDNPDATFVALSNQGGVEAGYKTLEDTIKESLFTLQTQPKLSMFTFVPDFSGQTLYICYPDGFVYFEIDEKGGYRKPDCKGLITIMELNGFSKKETLFYGDRDEDELAAKKAGIDFIRV